MHSGMAVDQIWALCWEEKNEQKECGPNLRRTRLDIENRQVVTKGKGRIGSLGLADANEYTGWINNKVLLYSAGNYIQYPMINHNGK